MLHMGSPVRVCVGSYVYYKVISLQIVSRKLRDLCSVSARKFYLRAKVAPEDLF